VTPRREAQRNRNGQVGVSLEDCNMPLRETSGFSAKSCCAMTGKSFRGSRLSQVADRKAPIDSRRGAISRYKRQVMKSLRIAPNGLANQRFRSWMALWSPLSGSDEFAPQEEVSLVVTTPEPVVIAAAAEGEGLDTAFPSAWLLFGTIKSHRKHAATHPKMKNRSVNNPPPQKMETQKSSLV